MIYIRISLVSAMVLAISSLCQAQDVSNQKLKELSKDFTKEIKALTLEKAPGGESSEWYQLAEELEKNRNQRKIFRDLRTNLPSLEGAPGGQDEAIQKYFETYKRTLEDGQFYDKSIEEQQGQIPYPFCIINDSCED